MNILLINHYAGSHTLGMEYRPYYLATEWTKKGHQITILASSFSHVRSVQPAINANFEHQSIEGVRYVWVITKPYKSNSIKRFFNILEFVYKLYIKSKHLAKTLKPDVVIASSTYPLDIYPAYRIAKKAKAKLIYEIHDLWPLSPIEIGGYSKFHPFIVLMQMAENFCYKHSDLVVSILPKTLEHCVEHGMSPEKWHYIPNGIQLEDMQHQIDIPAEQNEIIEQIKHNFNYVVGYAGSIGLANALDSFVAASQKLSQKNCALVIVGKGSEKDNLIKFVQEQQSKNVFFIDAIPKDSIFNMLAHFDFLYLGLKKQNLFKFGISPNKLFDYMYSGKPIIQAIDAGNDLVTEANCGITVEPENSYAIAKAIDKLINMPAKELSIIGKNGNDFVLKYHDYKIISGNFLNLILEILK
jgi:glycosyltransferase involved in cell wall biosynthesis